MATGKNGATFEVVDNAPRTQTGPSRQAGQSRRMNDTIEIDLVDLFYHLLDKIPYIILCLMLGAVVFNAYAFFCISPTYQSTAKLYVVSASNDSVVDLTDLNIGTSLTSDYEELILSYSVLDEVIEELDLDMSTNALKNMINLNNPTDTRILTITVTSTDRVLAKDIANKVAKVAVEYLPETMSTNAPNIAEKARLADSKSGPSYTRYTMMGALFGACLCGAYFVIRYLMDDTIHSGDDLEKYFDVVPLAVIPENRVVSAGIKQDKKNKHQKEA
ncbi:MAG: Wzz/FepE/Etk N-terminal domain-containing protein [Clostridiales bacterium]|nr:Wzz/FepE/Etk N-terminal domain-containing protein [Clostridiales bacterium]